jgi:ATP-binding cassette subfamily C protein PrsD
VHGPGSSSSRPASPQTELAGALADCKTALGGIGLFSFMINILMLTGAIFMLQVYDRVLPSRSLPTLVGLIVLALTMFAFLGALDFLRGRVLVRIGGYLDEVVSPKIYDATVKLPLRSVRQGDGLQPVRDFDQIRSFLSGLGPTALFDLPWLPIYLAICFAFHFWIGFTALIGATILVGLTILTEYWVRDPIRQASLLSARRNALTEASYRNAEVLNAMGMGARFGRIWGVANANYIEQQKRATDISGGLGAISRILRMILQSALLGVGAVLVLQNEASPGVIIAGSILGARAVAPVEIAIANWRQFVGARQSWGRLNRLLAAFPQVSVTVDLPAPKRMLSVEHISVTPPGERKVVAHDVSFQVPAGSAVGIIGQNAAGKSSLARAVIGVWPTLRGQVRLDGAALDQWSAEALGSHVGYLPQDVELFAGTIQQNIARFEPEPDSTEVIKAAEAAAVHQMILRLPKGYDTEIGEAGTALSAGQRQRIALARALYKEPFLVVLDEPNSNLDGEGEVALSHAIASVRKRGGIAIIVALRPKALDECDLALFMQAGQMKAFGPKAEVLAKILKPQP